jgi:hypothetical protein
MGGYFAQHDQVASGVSVATTALGKLGLLFLMCSSKALSLVFTTLICLTWYRCKQDPYMIEGYYEFPVNEFLTITPALIYGDPDTGAVDDDNFYGAIRATFSF